MPQQRESEQSPAGLLARRRGRPRKFGGPSRAVTVTLPLQVIAALNVVDLDLSRAIVRLAQPELARRPRPPAELARFGKRAVIVVTPTAPLKRRAGVNLVPLPDGRALISFDQPTTPAALELMLGDALDEPGLSGGDRAVFLGILNILRAARRAPNVLVRQSSIIVLESRQLPQGSAASADGRRSRRT